MNKYTIYHNPRCRKSREALQFLEESGHEIEIIRYLNAPLSKNELQDVLNKITLKPSEILRKNEAEWKSIPKRNSLSENEILEQLSIYPKLIERPIVTLNQKGVLARPLENLVLFLKAN